MTLQFLGILEISSAKYFSHLKKETWPLPKVSLFLEQPL